MRSPLLESKLDATPELCPSSAAPGEGCSTVSASGAGDRGDYDDDREELDKRVGGPLVASVAFAAFVA